VRPFDLLEPTTVEEAIGLLQQHGEDAQLIGGGAMLTILLRERLIGPRVLISVLSIPGLGDLQPNGHRLRIGATATLSMIEKNGEVRAHYPVLAEAVRLVGNVRVRNVATIGGHLAQADVHLDLPPVLSALGASVVIRGPDIERRLSIDDLLIGYYQTALASDEMIVAVELPAATAGLHGAYLKYCSLSPNDWPTVGVAAFVEPADGRATDVRIVAGSVSERPLRLPDAEAVLREEHLRSSTVADVARRYAAAAEPLPDVRGSVDYKRKVTEVYVRRAIEFAAARAGLTIDER
jgi:aerobic carbon-monoxide dehydrogenase medium subunit